MAARILSALIATTLAGAAADAQQPWEQALDAMLERASRAPIAEAVPPPAAAQAPHPMVSEFIRYFSGPGGSHYRASMRRLEPHRRSFEEIFRREGVPPQIIHLGLVESGFDPAARSPKDAVGVWQLIPDTARRFGLEVGARDDRTDPLKSATAAARYLKFLYGTFGDWPLALAAYNAGERRVQEAMDRLQTRDFWRLAAAGLLPRETRGYVPAVLAVQHLAGASLGASIDSGNTDEPTRHTRRIVYAGIGISAAGP